MSAEPAQTDRAANDLTQTIVHLSEKMQVSLDEVHQIYSSEFSRLAAEARIQQFVSILAIGRTRTILRESRMRSAQS